MVPFAVSYTGITLDISVAMFAAQPATIDSKLYFVSTLLC